MTTRFQRTAQRADVAVIRRAKSDILGIEMIVADTALMFNGGWYDRNHIPRQIKLAAGKNSNHGGSNKGREQSQIRGHGFGHLTSHTDIADNSDQ